MSSQLLHPVVGNKMFSSRKAVSLTICDVFHSELNAVKNRLNWQLKMKYMTHRFIYKKHLKKHPVLDF